MQKPQIKFEGGKLHVSASHTVDTDGDGKPAGTVSVSAELDAAEVISEVAKKDLPWLEALIAQIKA